MELLFMITALDLWGLASLSFGVGVIFHILSLLIRAKRSFAYSKGDEEYLVVCNQNWVFMWGLFVNADKDDTRFVNQYASEGWTLHSFSLRNGMISNIPLTKILLIWVIYIATLGYVSWISGSIFVFVRPVNSDPQTDLLSPEI